MRIGYVNYGTQSGVTLNVQRGLIDCGHEVELIDPTPLLKLRTKSRWPRPTYAVLRMMLEAMLRFPGNMMLHRLNTNYAFDANSRHVRKALRKLQPDVVLQNGALFSPGNDFPYALLLDNTCRLAQAQPAVPQAGLTAHAKFSTGWLQREQKVYEGAFAIATFSEVVRESLVREYGVDPSRVHVVGGGANVPAFPEPRRDDDGRTLVFIGKDGWNRKGGPILLEAFRSLYKTRPDLRLLIAGPNEKLTMPEGATNLGLVPLAKVQQLLSQATIFVLPTLREPFGIAFVDAMLFGAPCLGTRVSAVPEIIGDAGVVVPPGDPVALAKGYLWPEVARKISALLSEVAHRRAA
jgi:starch synthase